MKVFQIMNGFCHWDATRVHPSLASIPANQYHSDILFVEAPDYVFESWGFDDTQQGDARFIQPEPPEGWAYDPNTGTFYPIDQPPGEPDLLAAADERILELEYENLILKEGLA